MNMININLYTLISYFLNIISIDRDWMFKCYLKATVPTTFEPYLRILELNLQNFNCILNSMEYNQRPKCVIGESLHIFIKAFLHTVHVFLRIWPDETHNGKHHK